MTFKPDEETFYKIEDLEAAGLATKITIRKWIKSGRLKASLIGRSYLIKGEDVKNFILSGGKK